MKVGVITFQRSVSYGAFLQCLALQNSLAALGHTVEIIDYHPAHRARKAGLMRSARFGIFAKSNVLRLIQMRKFALATKQYLMLTSRRFESADDLNEIGNEFDAIICGSDQIWNASHTGGTFDPAYFADFAADGVRRISYAASLGGSDISPADRADFKLLAGKMNVVSLREESGKRLAEELLQVKCYQMPDPTFLFDGFSQLARPPKINRPYIFSFRMQKTKIGDALLAAAANRYNADVIHVRDNMEISVNNFTKVIPDPAEWLGLIASAEHVVTNSFHALALSIILGRPFSVYGLTGGAQSRSERLTSLLKTFALDDLYCENVGDVSDVVSRAGEINWSDVNEKRRVEQARGLGCITSALS